MTDTTIKNAKDLRNEFLKDAEKIVDRIKRAYTDRTGEAQLTSQEEVVMKQIWPTLEKIILSVEDTFKLDAKNQADVIRLVGEGKMSVEDGVKFMALLKLGAEVTAIEKGGMPVEGQGIGGGGITIVLPDPNKVVPKQEGVKQVQEGDES